MSNNQDDNEPRVVGFVGVGLDNQDGHQRLSKNEHFLLVGGSQETHERMQDRAIKFTEALRRRGKNLEDTSVLEVVEILREAHD